MIDLNKFFDELIAKLNLLHLPPDERLYAQLERIDSDLKSHISKNFCIENKSNYACHIEYATRPDGLCVIEMSSLPNKIELANNWMEYVDSIEDDLRLQIRKLTRTFICNLGKQLIGVSLGDLAKRTIDICKKNDKKVSVILCSNGKFVETVSEDEMCSNYLSLHSNFRNNTLHLRIEYLDEQMLVIA